MTEPLPLVSVIMPIRNEAPYIARSLEAVLAQAWPADRLEILVADGLSTDGTREIVQRLAAEHPCVRLLDNPGRIVATGLNRALRAARGAIVVRVDGHCVIADDYVPRCVHHLVHDRVDAVGGPLDTVGETPVARAIAAAMSSRFGVGDSAFRTVADRSMLTDTVAFPAYRRTLIDRAGPFDEELVRNQDDEYNYRLRGLGARILLAADVRCRYFSRSSIAALWRQYLHYGFWKVRVLQKHPRQMQRRQFVPPLFVAVLALSGALAIVSPLARGCLVAVLLAYAGALLLATTRLVRSRDAFLLMPIAFATLHLSYGIGFWWGLWRFRARWRAQPAGETRAGHEARGGAPCE